jgi:energy-coupling factor transporter ATP-binding protein EcfA2
LLGENGAGKSTLMNLLSGVHKPDEPRSGSTAARSALPIARGPGRIATIFRNSISFPAWILPPIFSSVARRLARTTTTGACPARPGGRADRRRSRGSVAEPARTATGRDRAGARRQRAPADPRRAYRVADTAGSRSPVRHHAQTKRERRRHCLHFPSAGGSAADR